MADQHLKTRDDGSITDCVSVVENENHRHRELPRHLDRAERKRPRTLPPRTRQPRVRVTGASHRSRYDPSNAAQAVRAALGAVLILFATQHLIARATGEPTSTSRRPLDGARRFST
jgi:hypothetical protein